ncbi:uncharacterized protein A1O5_07509 [Cladophialophora psammophila CBS 110553]|uniref:Uncharacterized protein n=1 Tax=Cladophialophora psammophila CBS 110553 TaxID=1182543 RepID=W9WNN3_9EURO|nr:uncharacterized protein A1O5_07509 [Cladophialophora psammophila CBS 110553]EXJ69473.1 hypothetical protein A1O5_07509 [Cladophialophora psammophila CBS 110553]
MEVTIILTKGIFCLEPTREIEIASIDADRNGPDQCGFALLLLKIQLGGHFVCQKVTTDPNVVRDTHASLGWQSTTAGLWIGQAEAASDGAGGISTRYLIMDQQKNLALAAGEPEKQDNQALQREFLAALVSVDEANVVPSEIFIAAVEQTLDDIKHIIATNCFEFWVPGCDGQGRQGSAEIGDGGQILRGIDLASRGSGHRAESFNR